MKKYKFPILLIVLISHPLSTDITAQNLVPNPGFELGVDTMTNNFIPRDWFNFTTTTDFFHLSNTANSGWGIPTNIRGYQTPLSGDGCAGIILHGVGLAREFLGIELTQAMKKDSIYEISFNVNLSNDCRFATDDVGASFFVERPEKDSLLEMIYHIKNPEGAFIRDSVNWTTITGKYEAKGGERFLVIGNFYVDAETTIELSNEEAVEWTYYYVDEVSVLACSSIPRTNETIDTFTCLGVPIVLEGLPGMENYFWEGIDATQNIRIDEPGVYEVDNFDGCRNRVLTYNVESLNCDCSLIVPTIQSAGSDLSYILSENVITQEINIFSIDGRHIDTSLDNQIITLPNTSSFLMWQANLRCIGADGSQFTKKQAGKFMVLSR